MTTRKPPKTARPRALKSAELPEVVRLTTSAEPKPVEMVTLFTIDDVEYGMPAAIRPNTALKYLRMTRTQGADIAAAWLLEEVLGVDAYEALMGHDDLEPEQLDQVMAIVEQHVLGQKERAGNG